MFLAFLDHSLKPAPNAVEVEPFRQRFLLLQSIHCAFQDVRRIEARWERTRREVLEGRHELEDFIHHSVSSADVVEVPVPVRVGGDVRPLKRVLHEIENLWRRRVVKGSAQSPNVPCMRCSEKTYL